MGMHASHAVAAAVVAAVDLARANSGPKLMWQPTKIPAAVRRRAQGLFKWRSDHQRSTASKAEYFRKAMKLVIDRMDPHVSCNTCSNSSIGNNNTSSSNNNSSSSSSNNNKSSSSSISISSNNSSNNSTSIGMGESFSFLPNFGLTNKTELHITVDAEQGLYVGGWVPASELLHVVGPKTGGLQLEARGELPAAETPGDFSGPEESGDLSGAMQAGPERTAAAPAIKRKVSSSQTRAKGLHQRLGHALQVKQNLKQVDLRRPFRGPAQGHKSIEDFLQERPRIRRQTCDLFSKGLTIRVHHPVPRPFLPALSASDASLKPPAGNMHNRRGSDILDPSNQLNRPFAWAEDVPELRVEGWKRAEEAGLPEAMIFVHGYNTNDVQSMQIMAQMAAFGNFPSYIKPFLFTWPSGENFLQFFDASENARNPQLHAAFTDFIRSLRDNGIRQIHLLAHSLGSRMLIMSLHRIEQEDLLLKLTHLEGMGEGPTQLSLSDQNKMHLVSLNFLNPEFYLEDFVATVRFICSPTTNIHICAAAAAPAAAAAAVGAGVADAAAAVAVGAVVAPAAAVGAVVATADAVGAGVAAAASSIPFFVNTAATSPSFVMLMMESVERLSLALWWSELFSGKQAMGRSVFGLYARPNEPGGDDPQEQEDLKTPPLYASSTACFQGYEPQHMKADTRDWLDVDVIDMTWLGNNVHALRHSYWSLNREVIEDLRELIVTRKRARQRTSRLDRREGNVWVYRVAPSSLTSIFDSDL
ncbi:hypothetical protein Emed_004017 [Eimeria media]